MTNASIRIIDRVRTRPRIKAMFRIILGLRLGLETLFLLGVKFCLVLGLGFMGRIRTDFR